MRGQMQAGAARLVIAPVRGRVMVPGRFQARKRSDEQIVAMAQLEQQRRDALRAAGRPSVALRRLPY